MADVKASVASDAFNVVTLAAKVDTLVLSIISACVKPCCAKTFIDCNTSVIPTPYCLAKVTAAADKPFISEDRGFNIILSVAKLYSISAKVLIACLSCAKPPYTTVEAAPHLTARPIAPLNPLLDPCIAEAKSLSFIVMSLSDLPYLAKSTTTLRTTCPV